MVDHDLGQFRPRINEIVARARLGIDQCKRMVIGEIASRQLSHLYMQSADHGLVFSASDHSTMPDGSPNPEFLLEKKLKAQRTCNAVRIRIVVRQDQDCAATYIGDRGSKFLELMFGPREVP